MIEATKIEAAANLVRQARGTVQSSLSELARGLNGEEHALHVAGSVGLASNDVAMVLDGPLPLSMYEAGRGALNALRSASNEIYHAPQAVDQPAGRAAAELRKADFWLGELDRYIAGDGLPDARITSRGIRSPLASAGAAKAAVNNPAAREGLTLPTTPLADVIASTPGRKGDSLRFRIHAIGDEYTGRRYENLYGARRIAESSSSEGRSNTAYAVFEHPDGGYVVQQARMLPEIFEPGGRIDAAGLNLKDFDEFRNGQFANLQVDSIVEGSPLKSLYWNGQELFSR